MKAAAFDFIVVGAGMAGLSVAAELSRAARVAVVERESQPGYHATGRSAALFTELYGNATIRALTRASRPVYFQPPHGFSDQPLISQRGTLYFGSSAESDALDTFASSLGPEARVTRLNASQASDLVPVFKPGYLSGALLDVHSADIDVAAVLQGYAAQCRQRAVHLDFDSTVVGVSRENGTWCVRTTSGSYSAPVVVNAGGAWGDQIAELAGARAVGLVPKRRTAVLIEVPNGAKADAWPAAIHIGETFYFKPDAGLLLVSPADETPSPPCDAQPEELDIAIAVDRFEQVSGTTVKKVRSSWAGLRSFVADKTPVVGFDPVAEGFFWLVGQGGYGIQTAPALARAAAALALRRDLPADLRDEGVDVEALAADRRSLFASPAPDAT